MKTKKLRLNAEIRKGISHQFKKHLENENTQEREAFLESRERYPNAENEAFEVIKNIVGKRYTKQDIDMQKYLDDKHNLDNHRLDNCFMVQWVGLAKETRYNSHTQQQEVIEVEKEQSKNFDFSSNASVEGITESGGALPFSYAMFREELLEKNCNPDIVAQTLEKEDSPHRKIAISKCNEFLRDEKFTDENGESKSILDRGSEKFSLDVLGSRYCHTRNFDISLSELQILNNWQQAKQIVCLKHFEFVKSIQDQMNAINSALKSYQYFDQAKELASTVGLNLEEIDKVSSNALTLYNPQSVAESLKSMKNKKISREDKIMARLLYERESASQSLN